MLDNSVAARVIKKFEALVPYIQYVYFLRFSLLVAAGLVGLRFLATTFVPTMFGGMLVQETWWSICVVSWMAFLAAWVAMITTRLTLCYGPERFGIDAPIKIGEKLGWINLVVWPLLALPLLHALVVASDSTKARSVGAITVGYLLSLVMLFCADLINRLFLHPDNHGPDFIFRFNRASAMAQGASIPLPGIATAIAWIATRTPPSLGTGYFDPKKRRLYSGHCLALSLLIVQIGIYLGAYYWLSPDRTTATYRVPALAYVLVLLITMGFIFTSLSFLLDYFRWPVLITAVAWSVFAYSAFDADHYYELRKQNSLVPAPVTKGIDGWAKRTNSQKPLVVIAASGGGIQAAGWTARVLTGLQFVLGTDFSDSIGLISSVSGGSVGTLFFVNEFSSDGLTTDPKTLHNVLCRSEQSSLAEAAWGFVFPDALRSIAPGIVRYKLKDRAWAMEQAWNRNWSGSNKNISDWRADLLSGHKPAVIMNATLAESGGRFILSNFDVPETAHVLSLNSLYQNHDLSMTTAARLSATFPYVTPMAQPLFDDNDKSDERGSQYKRFHIGDGGYYDNFGVLSGVEWLGQVLSYYEEKYHGKHVLLIQIRGSPYADSYNPRSTWGYAKQVSGPINTLLNVRTNAQVFRNDMEVSQLKNNWETNGKTLDVVLFEFDSNRKPPLSWHLTDADKREIDNIWKRKTDQVKDVLDAYARTGPRPISEDALNKLLQVSSNSCPVF